MTEDTEIQSADDSQSENESESEQQTPAVPSNVIPFATFNDDDPYFRPLIDVRRVGNREVVMDTFENFEEIFKRLKWSVMKNQMNWKNVFLRENAPDTFWANADNYECIDSEIVSELARFNMPLQNRHAHLERLACKNSFHPVSRWIMSKPWDGTHRLKSFLNTVKVDESRMSNEFKEVLIIKWMLNCILALTKHDGHASHGVLVFQGNQGIGKTRWFKKLCPENSRFCKDAQTLKVEDINSVMRVTSAWLCELGELESTFKKSDIAQMKAFLTSDCDTYRNPYGRKVNDVPRRTVFFGSVNSEFFLNDETGSRRFWAMPVVEINHSHSLDMQQVWREFYEQIKNQPEEKRIAWWLTEKEAKMLASSNEQFEPEDPIEILVEECFVWSAEKRTYRYLSATQIAQEIGIKMPNKKDTSDIRRILKKRKCENKKSQIGRVYFVPQFNSAREKGFS